MGCAMQEMMMRVKSVVLSALYTGRTRQGSVWRRSVHEERVVASIREEVQHRCDREVYNRGART